jgi:hypothetical protein
MLVTNNAYCIVQRATEQSKTGLSRDYGVAEAPPVFKPAGLTSFKFFPLLVRFSCASGISK